MTLVSSGPRSAKSCHRRFSGLGQASVERIDGALGVGRLSLGTAGFACTRGRVIGAAVPKHDGPDDRQELEPPQLEPVDLCPTDATASKDVAHADPLVATTRIMTMRMVPARLKAANTPSGGPARPSAATVQTNVISTPAARVSHGLGVGTPPGNRTLRPHANAYCPPGCRAAAVVHPRIALPLAPARRRAASSLSAT